MKLGIFYKTFPSISPQYSKYVVDPQCALIIYNQCKMYVVFLNIVVICFQGTDNLILIFISTEVHNSCYKIINFYILNFVLAHFFSCINILDTVSYFKTVIKDKIEKKGTKVNKHKMSRVVVNIALCIALIGQIPSGSIP